jgi:hypothetical protein
VTQTNTGSGRHPRSSLPRGIRLPDPSAHPLATTWPQTPFQFSGCQQRPSAANLPVLPDPASVFVVANDAVLAVANCAGVQSHRVINPEPLPKRTPVATRGKDVTGEWVVSSPRILMFQSDVDRLTRSHMQNATTHKSKAISSATVRFTGDTRSPRCWRGDSCLPSVASCVLRPLSRQASSMSRFCCSIMLCLLGMHRRSGGDCIRRVQATA